MRLAIVGGGSAGWMTAVYLDRTLNGTNGPKRVQITVIESPKIDRIGVGEATVPTILKTLQDMGISEKEFMSEADATFKQAIKFVDWNKGRDSNAYYHCFDRYQTSGRDNFSLRWALSGRDKPFAYTVSAQPYICDQNRAPKRPSDKEYQGRLPYAYHMDAEKFAEFLAKTGVERGIAHISDTVTDVNTDPKGIRSVVLEHGGEMAFDFFIDCTGFARLLMSQLPGYGIRSFSDKLLCDRAVAIQVPHDPEHPEILSSTESTAVENGWIWNISLQSRKGYGYVYSSAHCSDEDAETRLRSFIGPRSESVAARRLSFQSGVLKKPWVGNCVAVGLSAGFVEPMESTGIYFVEYAARMFAELFPIFGNNLLLQSRFNELIHSRYDEVLDFIVAHYVLSDRDDTAFWKEARKQEKATEKLQDLLKIWQHKMVSASDFANSHQLFGHLNYEYCVYGSNYLPDKVRIHQSHNGAIVNKAIQAAVQSFSECLPRNSEYFSSKSPGNED